MNYKQLLANRKTQWLFRTRKTSTSVVRFCSNDYLGLSQHPKVIKALQQGAQKYGVGSTASQLICGYSHLHEQLEQELAAFFKKDKAILFSAGYMANLGILTTLIGKDDIVIADKLCHASIIDGLKFGSADFKRYKHNDMMQLNNLLQQYPDKDKWIVTEGVFSMDGDMARLNEIVALKKQYNAKIILDDAHGIGVLGNTGKGTIEYLNTDLNDIDLIVGTFGKAFGGSGAFVVGDNDVIEYLIQFCRPFIYTTSLSPAMVNAMLASLHVIQQENWRREKLAQLMSLLDSNAPIKLISVGDAELANKIGAALFERGFWVGVIRPPTVPEGTARLRIGLNVEHTPKQIDALLEAIHDIL